MLLKKFSAIIVLLALAGLGYTIPSNITSKTPPKTPPTTPPTTPQTLDSVPALHDAITGSGISKSCAAAILTIVTSPEFLKCIPLPALLPLVPIIADPTLFKQILDDPANLKKLEQPLIQFSDGICAAPKCSGDGVKGAIKALQDGCKDDLKDNKLVQLLFAVTVFYSPGRDSICFKNDKKLYCTDETLLTVSGLPKSPFKITGINLVDAVAVSDPKALCTRCDKDIVNTFLNFIKGNDLAIQVLKQLGIDVDKLKIAIAVKCGIGFEDGKVSKPPGNSA